MAKFDKCMEELNKYPDALLLHDCGLAKFILANKKLRLIYQIGSFGYHGNYDNLNKIYKNPTKNSLFLAQEFDVTEFIDFTLHNNGFLDVPLSIGGNDLIGDDIMHFVFPVCGDLSIEFKFKFSSFKWEYIGEYETEYMFEEFKKFRNFQESIVYNW